MKEITHGLNHDLIIILDMYTTLVCCKYERLREMRRICTAGPPSDVAVAAVLFAPKSKQILIFNQDLSDLTKSLQNVGFMILKRPVIK